MHDQFLCDPGVLSITPTPNPEILDGCLNGGLILGSLECMINIEITKWRTHLNPQVYFINFMWNPRVSWVWEFNSISFIVGITKQWEIDNLNKRKWVSWWSGVRQLQGSVRSLRVAYVALSSNPSSSAGDGISN